MRRTAAKCAPRLLNDNQIQRRLSVCRGLQDQVIKRETSFPLLQQAIRWIASYRDEDVRMSQKWRRCCTASRNASSRNAYGSGRGAGPPLHKLRKGYLWRGKCRPVTKLNLKLLCWPSAETFALYTVRTRQCRLPVLHDVTVFERPPPPPRASCPGMTIWHNRFWRPFHSCPPLPCMFISCRLTQLQ
jgi:hypothetical protein